MQTDERWYTRLKKPPFTPPSWVFPIVWPVLYSLLAVCFVSQPSWLFVLHLGLNFAWSPVFFGWRRPRWALLILTLMVLTALRLRRTLPGYFDVYLAWILFAWVLNAYIAWAN